MGAAAARGTHAERVAQAKARNAAEVQRLEAQRAEERRLERERIDAMSEPERVAHIQGIQRQRTARARMQTLTALVGGLSFGAMKL